MRAAIAILLVASGCDALFGLRPVPIDPDARHDATLDGKLDARDLRPDGSIDAIDPSCNLTSLGCTAGHVFTVSGTCYAKCQDQLPYATAQGHCVAWGGSLAIIATSQEDAMVVQAMGNDTTTYWFGMQQMTNQLSPSAGWYWNDGVVVTNARWYTGPFGDQPDDGGSDKIEKGTEQCGWYAIDGWGDAVCGTGFQYLCKK